MSVRYKTEVGIGSIVIGAVFLILSLFQDLIYPSLAVGVVGVISGSMTFVHNYFVFDPATSTIVISRATVWGRRRFSGLLIVDGNRVFCVGVDGHKTRVPISRGYAREDQWRAFLAQITTSPVTGPAEY